MGAEYFEGSARDGLDVERPFLGAARGGLRQVNRDAFHEERNRKRKMHLFIFDLCLTCLFFDDKRYITPYSTKNTHWKIQDISR